MLYFLTFQQMIAERKMPYVQVKQKYQVTIPASIRKKIHLSEGDTLEAIERDGFIVFIPQKLKRKKSILKKPSLLSLAGINKNSGLYSSTADIDSFLFSLRSEWK